VIGCSTRPATAPTGEVSCSTCHDAGKAFTDSPLTTSEGINKLRGTRNAPTVINTAFNETQFWDDRSPDLEDQAQHPFINPVEMGLANHDPILAIVRSDPDYANAFKAVFDVEQSDITMDHVTRAIAAFERTVVAGNSPFDRWDSGARRMAEMAGLDNPNGSPFMVGEQQRVWLQQDLAKVAKDTPVVVLSHSPLQKIYKGWNFWTEDAEEVQQLLQPFDKVNVIYGHVHQIQYNQIGNIAFNSVMATAWPWPYPGSYAQAESHLPVLTVPMNRADPFDERDATGWQLIDLHSGRVDLAYKLYANQNRIVAFNEQTGRPEDTLFQDPNKRILTQTHF
jgi:hypothetical protein